MITTLFQNNECSIEAERVSPEAVKITVNNQDLLWIARENQEAFAYELCELLDRYNLY